MTVLLLSSLVLNLGLLFKLRNSATPATPGESSPLSGAPPAGEASNAGEPSREILQAANEKAREIVSEAYSLKSVAQKGINDQLEMVGSEAVKELKKVSGEVMDKLRQAGEKQAEAHKQVLVKRVEADIYQMLSKVSEEVIGESITPRKHEELVMAALEKYARV